MFENGKQIYIDIDKEKGEKEATDEEKITMGIEKERERMMLKMRKY